jgi:hypothetical protein
VQGEDKPPARAPQPPKSQLGAVLVSFVLCITYVDLITSAFGCTGDDNPGAGVDAAGVDVGTTPDTGGQGDVSAGGDGPSGDALGDSPSDAPNHPDAGAHPDASTPDAASSQPDARPSQPDASGPDAA